MTHVQFGERASEKYCRYEAATRRCPTLLQVRFDEAGCGNGVMAWLLRHRQTKEAETDTPILTPPRHIPTLPPFAASTGSRMVGFQTHFFPPNGPLATR